MANETSGARLHVWSGLIVLGVFLAGAFAGGGVYAWLRPPMHPPGMRGPPHGGIPPHLRELDLTPEQTEKAKVIFERERASVEAVLKEGFPRVRAAHDQSEKELRAILSEAQNKKLDEVKARFPPPRWGGGPGHGPPPIDPPPPPFHEGP